MKVAPVNAPGLPPLKSKFMSRLVPPAVLLIVKVVVDLGMMRERQISQAWQQYENDGGRGVIWGRIRSSNHQRARRRLSTPTDAVGLVGGFHWPMMLAVMYGCGLAGREWGPTVRTNAEARRFKHVSMSI